MEFSNNFLGGYFTKPINIRRFKTENSFKVNQIKMSKIKDRNILLELKSINPNIDLSNLLNEMKHCDTILQKYNFQDMFDAPDALTARRLLPIYENNTSDLQTPKLVKSDLFQKKKTKLYAQLPSFTPRGNITPGQTLLIKVSLYYPFHWQQHQVLDEAVNPHCKNVLQFHDAQTLQDLKQSFKCENMDSEISGDISENPHKVLGNFKINIGDLMYFVVTDLHNQ